MPDDLAPLEGAWDSGRKFRRVRSLRELPTGYLLWPLRDRKYEMSAMVKQNQSLRVMQRTAPRAVPTQGQAAINPN